MLRRGAGRQKHWLGRRRRRLPWLLRLLHMLCGLRHQVPQRVLQLPRNLLYLAAADPARPGARACR